MSYFLTENIKSQKQHNNSDDMFINYNSKALLFIDFPPWRIMLELVTKKLNSQYLTVWLSFKTQRERVYANNLLLDDIYSIQIEHEFEHLETPNFLVYLEKRDLEEDGLKLYFSIKEENKPYIGLLNTIMDNISR